MAENSPPIKKSISLDWFLRGALAKFGEMFDRFTGRNWQPSSSLATSELIERLKTLLDSKVRDSGARGRFVPHKLTLNLQWNKFSPDTDDSGTALKKLENELLTAAADHINDRRYHTFAPLELEIKQDYFTEGIKLSASFADVGGDESEMNVTVPDIKVGDFAPPVQTPKKNIENFAVIAAVYTLNGVPKHTKLVFENGRRLSVGRTKENDLAIEDASVSKIHASLTINGENRLMIADTGSTNGTFINDRRISYGKAQFVEPSDKVKFGLIEVSLEVLSTQPNNAGAETLSQNSMVIGDFEFKSRTDSSAAGKTPDNRENGLSADWKLENENSNGSRISAAKLETKKED